MNRFLLIAAMAALAMNGHAQALTFKHDWGQTADATNSKQMARQHATTHKRRAAARRKEEMSADDIIYAADGEERSYYRKTTAYYVSGDNSTRAQLEGASCTLTFGDDGNVYIYNPISEYDTYSYIVGKITGDTLTIHTPQIVDVQYNDDYTESTNIYLSKLRKTYIDANTYTFRADEGDTDLKFGIKNDTLTLAGGEDVMMALTNAEGTWSGYGNAADVLSPFSDEAVLPPDGAQTLTYSMMCGNNVSKGVNVAFDGSDVYIQGLSDDLPDSWVKARADGSTITLPSMQYLGLSPTYNYHIYLAGAKADDVYDPSDGVTYREYSLVPEVQMTLNTADRSFHTPLSLLTNAGKGILSYIENYDSPVFKPFDDVAATPADPTITTLMSYNEAAGYGGMFFTQPTEDTNGHWIDPNKMAYIVYGDDAAYEFTTDLYSELTDNMTEVPYNFTDGLDFTLQDGEHIVYFYEGGFQRIGVQSVYYGGGERRTSSIVYHATAGIDSTAATATPTSTVFYDLQGRQLAQPAHGLTLMRTTYSDGTVKVRKHLMR